MSIRSLNKVMLIGNLTRDPNVRFTPNNTAICSFGLATNRSWVEGGEKQDRVEFHNIVAWNKLAEICGNLLHKGDKVYVEGRLQTREWKADDGQSRRTTEVVIDDMMLLHHRGDSNSDSATSDDSSDTSNSISSSKPAKKASKPSKDIEEENASDTSTEDVEDISDDIPF